MDENNLKEAQQKALELWENADEKTANDMYIGWVGWDFIHQDFINRIKNYDDIKVLNDFLKQYKGKVVI